MIDYDLLAREIKANDEQSAITESHSSNCYMEIEAFVYMANTPKEMARKFKEQVRLQQVQHEMLQA